MLARIIIVSGGGQISRRFLWRGLIAKIAQTFANTHTHDPIVLYYSIYACEAQWNIIYCTKMYNTNKSMTKHEWEWWNVRFASECVSDAINHPAEQLLRFVIERYSHVHVDLSKCEKKLVYDFKNLIWNWSLHVST